MLCVGVDLQLEILRLLSAAWDARADAPSAAAELREWASYCGVSRAWRAHFANRPLRLAFDAPLSTAQARAPAARRKNMFPFIPGLWARALPPAPLRLACDASATTMQVCPCGNAREYGVMILDKCLG